MDTPCIPDDEIERLQALHDLDILDTQPEQRFDRLTRIAKTYFDVQIALVSLVDANRQWFKSRQGLEATETGRDISFCGHAILDKHIFIIPNALEDSRFADNPLVTGPPYIRFYAGAPLTNKDGYRIGTLCIIDNKPRELPAVDQQMLRDIADAVQSELNHITLEESAEIIKSSEAYLKAVVDTVIDGIITINKDGIIQRHNPAAEQLFGYTQQEMVGRNINMLMPEPYAAAHDGYLSNYLRTGHKKIIGIGREVLGKRKDGSVFPMELAVSEMLLKGEKYFVGITRDVSQRKEVERELNKAIRLQEAVINSANYSIISTDPEGIILTFNSAAERMLGYKAEEVINKVTPAIIHDVNELKQRAAELSEELGRMIEPGFEVFVAKSRLGNADENEWSYVRKDGSRFPVSLSITSITNESGDITGFLGVAQDLTEKKKVNQDLLLSQAESRKLAMVAAGTNNAVIITDAAGNIEWVNQGFQRISGYSFDEVIGKTPGSFLQGKDTNPDTVTFIRNKLRAGEGFKTEILNYHKNGSPYWLELEIQAIYNDSGKISNFIAIESDITSSRAQQEEIKRSHNLLNAISRAQSRFISESDPKKVFGLLLDDILQLTGSEYGFIGELLYRENGEPYLKTHGITNIAWNEASRQFYEEHAPEGMEINELDNLFGHVITSGKLVISNDPENDPRTKSLPQGHLAIERFLGVPFYSGGHVIGMLGVANCKQDYDEAMVDFFRPIFNTCGNLIEAWRSEVRRQKTSDELNQFKRILDNTLDMIFMYDPGSLNFHYCNKGAIETLGFSRDELMQMRIIDIKPDYDEIKYRDYLKPILEGKADSLSHETILVKKDGNKVPVEAFLQLVQEDNGKLLIIGIVRDISERKRIDQMKSQFVSTVSHELRTPLTSIRGALGLVLGGAVGEVSEKAKSMLQMANRNSERLALLINDILDLEKIESGKMDFEFKTVELSCLLKNALEANQGYADEHKVKLIFTNNLGGISFNADENRLLQVFANLISNAVKFSSENETVEVAVSKSGAWIRISVIDHGPGIPTEFHSRIFQRFAQADSSDTREKGGSGLGLSISKAIVEHHGGHIGFDSEPGKGSTFYFELPENSSIVESESSAGDLKQILVCEDNPDVSHLLNVLLQNEGFSCDLVNTAKGAKEFLKRKQYSALLLDLGLPDQHGLELIQDIKNDDATSNLPIIVVSALAQESKTQFKGDAVTVIDWIQKPFDKKRLLNALNQALSGSLRPGVLHVEDSLDVIQVTRAVVENVAEYSFATSVKQAKEMVKQHEYDLLILDVSLPDGSGLELLNDIKEKCPVIVFSGADVGEEFKNDVTAILTKSTTTNEQLLSTIRKVIYSAID